MRHINTKKSVKTTRRCTVELTGDDIRSLLNQELKAQGATEGLIPASAAIEFHVPGGADWSNVSLDIDKDNPVHIEWVEIDEVQS